MSEGGEPSAPATPGLLLLSYTTPRDAAQIKMAYYTRGEGKPLLMINGYLSTMSLWDPALLERLEKNRQLILFDNRGVGLSSDTEKDNTTIPQMADDAAGLIRKLGYDKVDILAWSRPRPFAWCKTRGPNALIRG